VARIKTLGTLTATVLLAAACQDISTMPNVELGAALERGAASGTGLVSFPCTVSRRTPEGPYRYAYERGRIGFPQPAVHDAGATTTYSFVVQGNDAQPLYVAKCVIPSTLAAVRHMDRVFGVRREGSGSSAADRGDLQPMGCVIDGVCLLEPIVVYARASDCATAGCPGYSNPQALTTDPWGGGGGGGGGDGAHVRCEYGSHGS
jgi:hypothetical protein